MNKNVLLQELDLIKSPEQLLKWMKSNINYWQHDNGTIESFDQILESKKGDCYDQVEFEKIMFRRMNIKYGCLHMFEWSNWPNIGNSHSMLYYYKGNKIYWFENAWYDKAGIHGPYNSINDLKDDIAKNWDYKKDKFIIHSLKGVKPGMTHNEYVMATTQQYDPNNEPEKNVYHKNTLNEDYIEEKTKYVPPEIMKPIAEEFKQLKDKEILDYLDEASSKLDKNFKKKTGGNFEYIDFNDKRANEYLDTPYFKEYGDFHKKSTVGEIVIDKEKNKLAGYIFVYNKQHKYSGFITPLDVMKPYRGYGLSHNLIKDAISKYNAIDLVVDKNNEVAIDLYKKHGFVIVSDGDKGKNQYYMKLKSKLTKDDEKYMKEYFNEATYNITYSTSFNDVKKVIDSLSDDDINRICNGTFKNSPYVIYREVLLVNKKPVSFIDVYKLPNMKEDGCIVIATNPKYRNMGYGSILISNMKKRLKGKNLIWKTQDDNDISIGLAKKYEYNPVIEEYIEERAKYDTAGYESKYFEKDDAVFNMDKWNPYSNNILYITGISGSGKTTLANDLQEKYNIERIELDYIIAYYIKKFIDGGRRENFIKNIKRDCPDALEFFTPERDDRILLNKWNEHKPVTDEFMTWFLQTHSNNGTLYIINGAQIADSDVLNDDFLHDKPIIIKHGGSSVLKSILRRLRRELKYAKNIPEMFRIVKSTSKLLTSKSGYLDGINRLKTMDKLMQKEEALSMSEYEPLENIFVPLYTPEELENTGIYDKEPDGVNPMAFAHAKQWFDNYKNLGYISEDYENKILYILHSGKVNEADSMLRLYGWDPDVSINEIKTRQEKVRNYLQEQRKVTLVNLTESAEEEESFVYELKGIREAIKRRINEFINSSSKFASLASSTTEDNKDGDGKIPEYDEETDGYSIFRVHTHDGIKLDLIDDYVAELNNYLHLIEEKYELFYKKLNSDFYCIYVKSNMTTGDTGFISNMESTALSSASIEKDTPEAVPEEIRIKSLDDLFVKYSDREEKGISPIV